jgi:hypothetical protein
MGSTMKRKAKKVARRGHRVSRGEAQRRREKL